VEGFFDLILSSGLRPPLFDPDVLALDQEMPRSELFAVLLLQHHGELSMSALAEHLGAPLSTATGVGGRLARRGLVSRKRHADDRRIIRVRLTPKGRALAVRLRKHVDSLVQRVQTALTEEELAQLISLVGKVIHAFRAQARAAPPGMKRIPVEE
jgi:MarR family transcriptional regulator, organic hydroperoxide resistance regulator